MPIKLSPNRPPSVSWRVKAASMSAALTSPRPIRMSPNCMSA
jgi:hypothetical protein